MSDKRYEANIIRATAVEPANNLQSTSAPGVWSIDEVVELQKKNKWPTVGNVVTNVEDCFSCTLYEGNAASRVIDNRLSLGQSFGSGGIESNGGWTNVTADADFNYGTGDFTIEFFVWLESYKDYFTLWDQRTNSQDATTNSPILYGDNNGVIYYYIGGSARITTSSNMITKGAWTHIAIVRNSGTTNLYIGGSSEGSFSDSISVITPANVISFGGSQEQGNYSIDGYMAEVRVVKGTAVYTSGFTPPNSALTAITNTKLLTAQGSTPFVDNSTIGRTVAPATSTASYYTAARENGNARASTFGPFNGASAGDGGMVWIKNRDSSSEEHNLYDTVRDVGNRLVTTSTAAESFDNQTLKKFTSGGFTVGTQNMVNQNSNSMVAWTWKKQEKFFDIQTWTGDGTSNRSLSHSLNSDIGMIIAKSRSSTTQWMVWHRSMTDNEFLRLNTDGAQGGYGSFYEAGMTTTTFGVTGTNANYGMNINGATYVAYLFAHNNNDGGFGPDQNMDAIKCGTFTHSSNLYSVDLGFEPQWVMMKRTDSSEDWKMWDNMRGWFAGESTADNKELHPNTNAAEDAGGGRNALMSTGWREYDSGQLSDGTYIYMAIRRTPTASPTSGADVFGVGQVLNNFGRQVDNQPGNPVDFAFGKTSSGTASWVVQTRITSTEMTSFNTNGAAGHSGGLGFQSSEGYHADGTLAVGAYGWQFRRAPGFYDHVAYVGTGAAQTLTHHLGSVPELLIWKNRTNSGYNWVVKTADMLDTNNYLVLEGTNAQLSNSNYTASATATSVTTGTAGDMTQSSADIILHLFGTVAGVSKVGSYTGNGSSSGPQIDCGFTAGARFILIKSLDSGSWATFDTYRGIASGDDSFLQFNSDQAPATGQYVNPYSSGFQIATTDGNVNTNGHTYIFLAVA